MHANPWAHVRLDPDTGDLVERPNPYPTPESLYDLCDKHRAYEAFKDDVVVRLLVALETEAAIDVPLFTRLAATLNLDVDVTRPDGVWHLYRAYALRASMHLVRRMQSWAAAHGKQLMILLSYPEQSIMDAVAGKPRVDQEFVTFVQHLNLPVVDALHSHLADYKGFNLPVQDYVARYYNGHYSPRGNHFFAFAIKDALVAWLKPRPPLYREEGSSSVIPAAGLASVSS
jgi:hypothetical protein